MTTSRAGSTTDEVEDDSQKDSDEPQTHGDHGIQHQPLAVLCNTNTPAPHQHDIVGGGKLRFRCRHLENWTKQTRRV